MCDECKGSNAPSVSQDLVHFFELHEQVCSRTVKYQAYQYVPHVDMSEQFWEHTLDTSPIDPTSFFELVVVKACMVFRLCITVALFCLPIRNIAPHIALPDLPCHRTRKRCPRQVSLNKVVFLVLPQRFWIQTHFCHFPQYFSRLTFSLSATQIVVGTL